MKHCNKCGETKELVEFYRNAASNDGLSSNCKACVREYRQSDAAKTTRRAWAQSDAGKVARRAHCRAYSQSEAGRRAHSRSSAKQREKSPFKIKAKSKVQTEIRAGRMQPASDKPCEQASAWCGGRHEHHHDSYLVADWLRVRVLCHHHHKEWHRNNTPTPYDGGE